MKARKLICAALSALFLWTGALPRMGGGEAPAAKERPLSSGRSGLEV